jgi:glycosyltransferase involved in cell wall biosynthesis
MPCFNAEQHLQQSINSVFNQTYPNLELIVINDGSSDGSLQILKSLSDSRLTVLDQPNLGVCKTRNRGILAAKGELIAFLDADDTWDPECLKKLYQALVTNQSAALAYCGWQNIGLQGGAGQPYVPPDYETMDKLAALFQNCLWPIHACLSRKQVIFEAGLFDESFLTSEDFLLWLKIGSQNNLVRVPEVLAFYHFHDGVQATRNKERVAMNLWYAQQKFLQQNPEIESILGKKKIRQLMHGELLSRGFECYWKRDLKAARTIFRKVMMHGYGSIKEWMYMLPSLLPFTLHRSLILLLTKS